MRAGTVDVSMVLFRSDLTALREAIGALVCQAGLGELRILINAADDDYVAGVRAALQEFGLLGCKLIVRPDNLGFAGGHNLLARMFLAERSDGYLLVLNPDLVLGTDALATLADAADCLQQAVVGPVLWLWDGPGTPRERVTLDSCGIRWTADARHLDKGHGERLSSSLPELIRTQGISGACMLVSRVVLLDLMGEANELFDELFLAYREDAELAYRAAIRGIDSWTVSRAEGWHRRSQRGTTRGTSVLIDQLGVQNRFLFAFKYGCRRPGSTARTLIRDCLVVLAVLISERSSLAGLRYAWRLRRFERYRGKQVLSHVHDPSLLKRRYVAIETNPGG